MTIDEFVRDEEGFTTAGMAIAILLSLCLLFSAAQVYRINSAAAEIQEVADATALAVENEVAEFMVAARLCDGVVLSMSLLGIGVHAVGVVALCVPPAAEVGAKLVEVGSKVLEAKTKFAKSAARGLNQLQRALPFLAAAHGAATAAVNGKNRSCNYYAMGMLIPFQGEPLSFEENKAEDDLEEEVEENQDALAQAGIDAENAARAANRAKQRAFQRDCGDNPGYCMYERASQLANMSAQANPLYQSVDAWSFSVPLARARAYYRARLASEAPDGSSVDEQARSALRKRFYRYAVTQLDRAYVRETAESFDAYFPRLPRNTEQMRSTTLYFDVVYPVTEDADGRMSMHAWEGCPRVGASAGFGSIQMLDEGSYEPCPECQFKASSLGSVASASTSIENGFEYHYDAVAQAAEEYQKELAKARPLNSKVKSIAQSLLDEALEALKGVSSQRISVKPPGSFGCIVLVVSPKMDNTVAPGRSFVSSRGTLGARVAISAATLVEDNTDGASVIGDLLNGFKDKHAGLAGAGGLVLDCWSAVLGAYGSGQKALTKGIEDALNGLPLVGASGLGTWAADALRDCLKEVGLEPARDAPLKPVLVNSGAVAGADSGAFAVKYQTVKEQVLSLPATSSDPFASLADYLEREAFERLSGMEIEIARIELPLGGLSFPLTITLPPTVTEGASGLVERAGELLRSLGGSISGLRAWQ